MGAPVSAAYCSRRFIGCSLLMLEAGQPHRIMEAFQSRHSIKRGFENPHLALQRLDSLQQLLNFLVTHRLLLQALAVDETLNTSLPTSFKSSPGRRVPPPS